MADTGINCVECGACCRTAEPLRAFIPLTRADVRRLPVLYQTAITTSDSGYDYLRTGPDKRRCVALTGTIGKEVSCDMYDDRPDVCRRYERGGWQCLQVRKDEGLS